MEYHWCGVCNALQTYKISSSGVLTFNGATEFSLDVREWQPRPSLSRQTTHMPTTSRVCMNRVEERSTAFIATATDRFIVRRSTGLAHLFQVPKGGRWV